MSGARELLNRLKQEKAQKDAQKKGGKGGSNFLTGLVDLPLIMSLSGKIQFIGLCLSGYPQDLVQYSRILIDKASGVLMGETSPETTILDKVQFSSKKPVSVQRNGRYQQRQVVF